MTLDLVSAAAGAAVSVLPAVAAGAGAARLGGDEFAAVITLDPREESGAYSQQLVGLYAHLTRPAATPAGDIHVDVTIGAVLVHRGHTDLDGLLTAADTAMYAARRGGLSLRLAYGPLPTPANRPRLRRRDAHNTTTRSEVAV